MITTIERALQSGNGKQLLQNQIIKKNVYNVFEYAVNINQ